MWKRHNNNKGVRQPAVTDPALEEVSYGARGYADPSYNRTAEGPSDRSRLPPRPPREDTSAGFPRLPFEPSPPPPPQHRQSSFRPTSSIYSQPSPDQPESRFPRNSYAPNHSTYTDDVSPPSSPELGASKSQQPDDYEVSPIDETPDISRLHFGRPGSRPGSSSKPPSSNIPVLRREKRRAQVEAAATNPVSRKEVGDGNKGRKTVDPRWDPYSGEITTSDKGKPQSVKPGQFTAQGVRPIHQPTGAVLGNESNISGPQKSHSSFGDRVRKLKSNTIPSSSDRPEWRGATGRVTLVSPVADQPDILPLSIPRKSSKRVASPVPSTSPVSVIRSGIGETTSASAQRPEHADPTIKTVLSNIDRNSPRVFHSPISLTPEPAAHPLSSNPTQVRGGDPIEVQTHQRKDSTGTIERNFREAFKDVSFNPGNEPYVQPPSRFSVTTYAPSEHSPRASVETVRPPMPTPPQTYTTTQQPSPILNRKRPKVDESPKATTRKAINPAPTSSVFISMSTTGPTSKRASNIAKTLPQSPAEAESHDLITSLQAQLDNLAHRRNNITRSIRQMTELMPTDHVVVTAEVRRKRDDEKRKVEGLKEEEADVRSLEHEIGLKLHRAYKRRDKDSVYEPTGLWVRRVTG